MEPVRSISSSSLSLSGWTFSSWSFRNPPVMGATFLSGVGKLAGVNVTASATGAIVVAALGAQLWSSCSRSEPSSGCVLKC